MYVLNLPVHNNWIAKFVLFSLALVTTFGNSYSTCLNSTSSVVIVTKVILGSLKGL